MLRVPRGAPTPGAGKARPVEAPGRRRGGTIYRRNCYGPDGFFYVAVSQLHRSAALNAGVDVSRTPFLVLRFRPLAAGVVGR